ncbi:hypothetical protein HYY75_10590, partial [bacterium]|nr:hypothetical protein [bacterium]
MENQVLGLEWFRNVVIFPFRFFSRDFRVVAEKEVTNFVRDPALFAQIFMIGAIIFVYFFNLKVMPLKDIPTLYSGEINDSMVYFNGPFIGFILSAMCMRFVYPSISLEGRAFWAVKASPMNPSRLISIKYFLYLWPTLVVGLILCLVSNSVFRVTQPIIMWVSYLNVILMAIVISALAVGVGAIYSRFDIDNPLKIAGSFGGFVFMIFCSIYIVNLLAFEAYPAWRLYLFRFYPKVNGLDIFLLMLSFLSLLVCSAFWALIPLWKGMEKIKRYEPE